MSRLPLQSAQGFVMAARHLNMSRAADALHLTVSALSHQIRGLEDRLQQRLFERGPRGLRLTADGQRLYDAVSGPFDALERALRPCACHRDDVLTVSMLPSMANSWLVPRLPAFLAANPQLSVNLQSSVEVVDFDRDAEVDAAMRYGQGSWPGVTAERLFGEWIAPLASPSLIARIDGGAFTSLDRYPLLDDTAGRWPEWFRHMGGEPPTRFAARLDDAEALHRAAASGLGVAMGRMTLAKPLIDAGMLVPLSDTRLPSTNSHWLVYPPRSREHRGFMRFREWLLAEASAYEQTLDSAHGH